MKDEVQEYAWKQMSELAKLFHESTINKDGKSAEYFWGEMARINESMFSFNGTGKIEKLPDVPKETAVVADREIASLPGEEKRKRKKMSINLRKPLSESELGILNLIFLADNPPLNIASLRDKYCPEDREGIRSYAAIGRCKKTIVRALAKLERLLKKGATFDTDRDILEKLLSKSPDFSANASILFQQTKLKYGAENTGKSKTVKKKFSKGKKKTTILLKIPDNLDSVWAKLMYVALFHDDGPTKNIAILSKRAGMTYETTEMIFTEGLKVLEESWENGKLDVNSNASEIIRMAKEKWPNKKFSEIFSS